MASQVEIMNRALVILGEARISAPGEDIKAARELSAVWDTTRRALLRAYPWSFAMSRIALAPSATAPAFGYTQQFPLPADFIRLHSVAGIYVWDAGSPTYEQEPIYTIESTDALGAVILCDIANPLNVRYIRDVTNPALYDALFVEAFSGKLATDVATTLTNSDARLSDARGAFGLAIERAVNANAIEKPPLAIVESSWLLARNH